MAGLFRGTRAATWPTVAFAIVAYLGATLTANALFDSQPLVFLYDASRHLVQGTLVGGVFVLLIVGLVIFAAGDLRFGDVGWRTGDALRALCVTLFFWLTIQCGFALVAASAGSLVWHPFWKRADAVAPVGSLIGQLFGNALAEETVFRGFLLPQLYVRTAERFGRSAALTFAAVGSSAVFAVSHLPNRLLVKGMAGMEILWDQAGVFVFGLIFVAIIVVTRNVFVATGFHALLNEPLPVVRLPNQADFYAVWFGAATLFVVGYWLVRRKRSFPRSRTALC